MKKYKRIIVILNIFFLVFFCFTPKKANAIFGVDDAVLAGGAFVVLVGATLVAGNVSQDENYQNTCKQVSNYLANSIEDGVKLENYVRVKTIQTGVNAGKQFLTWTQEGFDWFANKIEKMNSDGSVMTSDTSIKLNGIQSNRGTMRISMGFLDGTETIRYFCNGYSYSIHPLDLPVQLYAQYTNELVGLYVVRVKDGASIGACGDNGSTVTFSVNIQNSVYKTVKDFDTDVAKARIFPGIEGSSSGSIPISPGIEGDLGSIGIPVVEGVDGGAKTYVPDVSIPNVENPSFPVPKTWEGVEQGLSIPQDVSIPKENVDNPSIPNEGVNDKVIPGDGTFRIPILTDILDILKKILDFLLNMLLKLIEMLKDLLISLFVPSKTFVVDEFSKINDNLNKAFPCNFDVIESLKSTNQNEPDLIYKFAIMGVDVCMDLNFIKKIVPVARTIANGLVIIFLVWYHFRKIIWLIRGTVPFSGDGHTGQGNAPLTASPVAPSANSSANSDFRSGNFS